MAAAGERLNPQLPLFRFRAFEDAQGLLQADDPAVRAAHADLFPGIAVSEDTAHGHDTVADAETTQDA